MSLKRRRAGALVAVMAAAAMTPGLMRAQANGAQQPNFTLPGGAFNAPRTPDLPVAKPITANGVVVEDAVARVNDQVITRTEFERSEQQLVQEAKQENWSPTELADKQRTLLRDMIDQQLLLSKGKELGISGDAEVARQLDEIRKRANLPDMESLEKAAAEQGVSYEDFKQNIRNQVITQQVVRDEVGRRLNITPSQEQGYYQAHLKDFEQPEQVHLSEILVPTPENATDAQISEAQTKAESLEAKLKAGTAFAEVARASSGGPTASAGGDLGDFKRGMLGDVLEKATFSLPVGGYTEPIRTRQGFVILKVDSHQQAGTPPLQQVENQVQEGLYMSLLQPALRNYLTQARQDAYLEVKPGFTDVGSLGNEAHTSFTTYTPPPVKKKVIKKQRAEQLKAEKAEKDLAAAREKVAEKQQAKLAVQGGAPAGGARNAGFAHKTKKVKREKVRFGQAPRNALPNGTADATVVVPSLGNSTEGNNAANNATNAAPGTALAAPGDNVTSISTGASADAVNPLEAQNDATEHKTRFSSRQNESDEKKAQAKLAKAEVGATKRPQKATVQETADEKVQSAPLGLQDKTKEKKKKVKRAKDQPKERLQEKEKPAPAPQTVEPSVNPSLGTSATRTSTQPASGTSDQTTLPNATTGPANAPPQGQPIPAVTGTQPNAPTTTVPQPQ
jgi:peptidyl-prolyl cis-trans isomerase SurA